MTGHGGSRTARHLPLALAILSGLLVSCAPPSGLVLFDSLLAILDPGSAGAYTSFRSAGTRWTAREYPIQDPSAIFGEFLNRPPRIVLLSPLISSEYQAVREAFPEAWVLGTGIPAGDRTISAVWDPVPAAREAGARAGIFLRDREQDVPEPPEALILVSAGSGGSNAATEAFKEGLASVRPGTPIRIIELSGQNGQADVLFRDFEGSGAKAVFLDAGAGGFRVVRSLREPPSLSGPPPGPRFTILRSPLTPPEDAVADLFLLRNTQILLQGFRSALRAGKTGSISVPETAEPPPGSR
mgnify:CR=1 FL=1